MPKYSIVTIASNGIQLTSKCIESIFNCTEDFEIIVIDNNSTDGTSGYLQSNAEAHPDKIKIIESKKNLTFAENNNLAIPLCEGSYIIFLNNDTVVTPHWLERMEAHFHNVPVSNIGCVGPVSSMSNGIQMVGEQDPEQWHANYRGRWKHTGIIYGWCMMFKREVIDKIGGFDERFENSYEDNDLCLRTQLAGYNLIVAYDTYIYHLGQGTLRQTLKSSEEYAKKGEENRERYFDKYWDPEKPRKLVAVYRTAAGAWLEKSLEQTSKFADSIILHFCRAPQTYSSDRITFKNEDYAKVSGTREDFVNCLKAKFPKIVKVAFYDGIFQEDYERGWLLEEALKMQEAGEADWCISVDDDELYEEKFIDRCKKMMSPRNPEVLGYWCNWRTIWETRLGKEYYRTDSTFGSFTNYRFFRLIQGQKIISRHPEGHHCGSAPWLPDENLRWSSIRVKHMGYDTPEQRQRKYEFYEANDHFKTRQDIGYDDYRHLISLNPQLQEYRADNGISLIMMVKNEEEFLSGLLENIMQVVDEFIIVDTGSDDKTVEIIEKFAKHSFVPVTILKHEWVNNYSIPRNYAKKFAKYNWVMFMDADERFEPQTLPLVFKSSEGDADVVMFNVNNYLKKPENGEPMKAAPTQSARLFRNIPEFYFTGVIHETIDDASGFFARKNKLKGEVCPATIHHYGYLKEKRKVNHKLNYYEELNLKQLDITEGLDFRSHFNLALHYLNNDDQNKALAHFQESLRINPAFYHASNQMAALNINSAKHFLGETLKYMPDHHPGKEKVAEILRFLNEKSQGFVKVG